MSSNPTGSFLIRNATILLSNDDVYGVLLQAVLTSKQAFCFGSLTTTEPLAVDYEDGHNEHVADITVFVNGPCAVTEDLHNGTWRLDTNARYRVISSRVMRGKLIVHIEMTDDARLLFDEPESPVDLGREDLPVVIRAGYQFMGEIAVHAVTKGGLKTLKPDVVISEALSAVGFDAEEAEGLKMTMLSSIRASNEVQLQMAKDIVRKIRSRR